jgi:glucokinase
MVEKEFNLPVLIENDATSACFGEQWLNLEQGLRNVLYMFSGVGCGIMINGEVYRGSQGYAGEVAVYNYKEQDLFGCDFARGCFIKRWEMDLGIVADAKDSLIKDKATAEEFFRLTSSNINNVDLKSVFIAARANNPLALAALERAAKRLGVKIAHLVNLLNPQIVIIGGGLEEAGEGFLNKVNATVREWAFYQSCDNLRIAYSQLRENAVALGAASLLMQKIFAQLW